MDKVHVGRWIGTSTVGATDGVSDVSEEAALAAARAKLVELDGGPVEPHWLGLAKTQPLVAGFVPSMVRLDAPDGSPTYTSSDAEDAWVFEFRDAVKGVLVIVDADRGSVSMVGGT